MAGKNVYREENRRWFEDKCREEGVVRLSEGVSYRSVAEGRGDGRHPQPNNIVVVHYTGWTIDGREFDSSRGDSPLAIRLRELIEGWIVALGKMCIGDRWEVYIDADRGYGQQAVSGIPAGSTLVFDIELLNIV